MKHIKILSILAAFVFVFTSCEEAFFEEENRSVNPKENFEYLWNECNDKYSYFELKKVDWNAVKTKYEPRVYEGMTNDSLFRVLRLMLNELKDGHVNLITDFNASSFYFEQQGQDNYDARILRDNYVNIDYQYISNMKLALIDNGNIGYIRYDSFLSEITEEAIDIMLDKFKDTKGIIIDVRENGGGDPKYGYSLLSRFIDKEMSIGYSQIKTGPGKDEFSEPVEIKLQPYDGKRYSRKVALLTDRGSFSATSYFAAATIPISNVIRVGDITGGGLGVPNGGQLPNGWTYRFSVSKLLTLDKDDSYENGVPPDFKVGLDWSDKSKDEILEFAINELKK